MIVVHHLNNSRSQRVLWLLEELGQDYEIKRYERDRKTMLAPASLRAVHPLGKSPVITDGDLVLAESGAIVDYILARHGGGRLALPPAHPDFAQYLYWFHFANGNLQPSMGRNMILRRLDLPADNATLVGMQGRLVRALQFMDARLAGADYLAGNEFTAADIMTVFSVTTMRLYMPIDLAPYTHILAWLARIGARPAYQRAMAKGDPDLVPMLS